MADGLFGVLMYCIGVVVFYWMIRLAVSHGIADAERHRRRRGEQ